LIWDITRSVNPNYNKIRSTAIIEATFTVPGENTVAKLEPKYRAELIFEPKHAFAKINEEIFALCWFPDSKHELLYGTETHVKLCDTREYQSHHKGVYEDQAKGQVTSIKFDPFDSRRFAALTEENLKVYDIRYMRSPIVKISQQSMEGAQIQ
jgi:hypothetical protein